MSNPSINSFSVSYHKTFSIEENGKIFHGTNLCTKIIHHTLSHFNTAETIVHLWGKKTSIGKKYDLSEIQYPSVSKYNSANVKLMEAIMTLPWKFQGRIQCINNVSLVSYSAVHNMSH